MADHDVQLDRLLPSLQIDLFDHLEAHFLVYRRVAFVAAFQVNGVACCVRLRISGECVFFEDAGGIL